jgi:CheY-like chemotaxis protein
MHGPGGLLISEDFKMLPKASAWARVLFRPVVWVCRLSYWRLAQQALTYCTHLRTFIGNVLTRSVMATIVIVEDEPQISALVQSFIEEQGHKVLSAATADEALGILKGPQAVDALFVDISLKGDMEAGIKLAKQAVELKPDLKVLYSTGLTVTEDMKGSVVPGSIVLEKPYSEDQLLASLSVLRGGSRPSVRD